MRLYTKRGLTIIANKYIGENGGKYRFRFKNSTADWSPWLNLGGGLKFSDVEVELLEAVAQPSVDSMEQRIRELSEALREAHEFILEKNIPYEPRMHAWTDVMEQV